VRNGPAAARSARPRAARGASRRGSGAGPVAAPAARPAPDHLFRRSPATRYPRVSRARGVYIVDADGKRYLDGCSGAVVCNIGYGVREVIEAMGRQARQVAFAHSTQFISQASLDLSAALAALCPGPMAEDARVYLSSGGSEAVESAIKLARQYFLERGEPRRTRIVARWQSYHGSTLGALSATGNRLRRKPYEPMLLDFPHIAPVYCYRCPFDLRYPSCLLTCADDLARTLDKVGPGTVAAFIAEPVVGATLGAVPPPDGYWQRIREICDRHGILLIADEVMTGVGRTGTPFGLDHWGVVPDIIVVGKGCSAGYTPLGAIIARGFIHDAIRDGSGAFEHGFTYSANPLSAATGVAVLRFVRRRRLVERARTLGPALEKILRRLAERHPIIGDVRGMGLFWGLEFVRDRATREPFEPALKVARRLGTEARQRGLLLYPGTGSVDGQRGDHVIVAPPLTITGRELARLGRLLDETLTAVEGSLKT
jgi:adenosylmethionine-8-amino-7-oxononanoate aminotransferase